ncbi:MAG: DUF4339 domain-containing protein [Chthoniobacter sp.]|nr:DUF4339 domain-containing protein [Chthoniobacter sp.]
MISPEVFYVHVQGEQRGPYTIPQIDHMLNSGLIERDTLYWREGMEQWQPVTELVVVRELKNPWIKPGIAAAVVVVLAILVRMFGPITMDGWRETNQHEFTEAGAYWRARDTVRNGTLPKGSVVLFGDLAKARVNLHPPNAAVVTVRGEVTTAGGQTNRRAWRVPMTFDAKAREWSGGPAEEVAP